MKKPTGLILFAIFLTVILDGCTAPVPTVFTKLDTAKTGINFVNENVDKDSLSILDYLYFYNGAGVTIGDINNDGLPDIYFASNTGGNKLYLNKGNFKFEDITQKAGVAGNADWTTGVTMADVNGDGLLDIYVCAVGNYTPRDNNGTPHIFFQHSHNQLFINNGNNTFTEMAAKYGLDITGYNTQAVFFDYDKDGDLDMFLLQHSTHQSDTYGDTSLRNIYSKESGGKMYRNDGGHFTDVTKEAGIISSALGYGLGVGVADFNHDGFDDIYVSNDFYENDYYYVNQGNGTFKEMNATVFGHESKFSMGSDIADINNDGWPDLMTVDMLPENEKVLKSSLADDPLDIYKYQRRFGYTDQYSRNCLQLNTGRGMKFADIALYSGVAATDWSWSPLIADYNLDGKADIFVSNGIKKRPNDLDYIKFISSLQQPTANSGVRQHDKEMLNHMPSGAWHNYIFEGSNDLKFTDRSTEWGFENATLAQGAAYADLDGDGALDLVTSNMNEPAGIYKNNTRNNKIPPHFLTVQLKGKTLNTFAIGAKVFLFNNDGVLYKEMQTVRGFMSSGEPLLNFGLGNKNNVDSLLIIWPDNTFETMRNIAADKKLTVVYDKKNTDTILNQFTFINKLLHTEDKVALEDITEHLGSNFQHKEDEYFDFNDQWFIPHELSTQGPKIAVGDVNKDGLEDFFVCGAKGQAGKIFLQQKDGSFKPSADSAAFIKDKEYEEVDAIFFDANNDGNPDLYVVSGGNVYTGNTPLLNDRLYLNDGKGNFTWADNLPAMYDNKSVVCVADFDHDGDLDIFVGGRSYSRNYSKMPPSYLLINDGKGKFSIAHNALSESLQQLGIVTGASWIDIDKDGWPDLVVVGEWMQPILFKNDHGTLKKASLTNNDNSLKGWWCSIKTADINGDGFDDILLGNYGLNSKLTASNDYPLKLYNPSISGIGNFDQILAVAKDKKYYPFLNKEDLEKQLPFLKKQFLGYNEMAGKTVEEIFDKKLENVPVFTANNLASLVLINDGKGHYNATQLPAAFQWAPIFCFDINDYNKDGKKDILAGGNFFGTTPYEGRYDAMPLVVGLQNTHGAIEPLLPIPTCFESVGGEVRSLQSIQLSGNKKGLLVGFNNSKLKLFELR